MTVIVGVVDKAADTVYIGGDRALVAAGGTKTLLAEPKVFRNGEFLIGAAGSCRAAQILQYDFKPPEQTGKDVMRYMVSVFIKKLRECCKTAGYATAENERESGPTAILGYKNRLFVIYSDYQVAEHKADFIAVGSGKGYALGAMFATKNLPPRERIQLALEAAASHDSYVAPPFDTLELHTEPDNNVVSKLGRNERCPCGSGKKYKKTRCLGKA